MIPRSVSTPIVRTTRSSSDSSDSSTASEKSVCERITHFVLPQEKEGKADLKKKQIKKETASKKVLEFLEQSPLQISKVNTAKKRNSFHSSALYAAPSKERRVSLDVNKIPFTDDIFSEVFINSDWERNLLKILSSLQQKTSAQFIEEIPFRLMGAIDAFYRRQANHSSVPNKDHLLVQEIDQKNVQEHLLIDTCFLLPLIERLKIAKKELEIIIKKIGCRTHEGERFRTHLRSLIRSENSFAQFMNTLLAFKKDKELYKLVNQFIHFTDSKDLLVELPHLYQRSKSLFDGLLKELHWFHAECPHITQKQQYIWRQNLLEPSAIDAIIRSQVTRSITMYGELLLDLTINGEKPEKQNGSYMAGIIRQINWSGFNCNMTVQEAAEEASTFEANAAIPCERILKMCSMGCWFQADQMIRKWFGELYEVPLHTICNKGIKCAISITDPDHYNVTQQKTFSVHRRRIPNDPECFTVKEPAIGEITFEWAISPMAPNDLRGCLRIVAWRLNEWAHIEDRWRFLRAITHYIQQTAL